MKHSASPLLKMSFETTCTFLIDATAGADSDNLESPSARLILGRPVSFIPHFEFFCAHLCLCSFVLSPLYLVVHSVILMIMVHPLLYFLWDKSYLHRSSHFRIAHVL